MQARSSCEPSSYKPPRRPSYPLTPVRRSPPTRSTSPPSPLSARYDRTCVDDWSESVHRRSVYDLVIPEEAQGLSSDLSATLHSHIDLSLEFLKRHHRPRPALNRFPSDPQILSTVTTRPIHIPKSPCVSLFSPSSPPPHFSLQHHGYPNSAH